MLNPVRRVMFATAAGLLAVSLMCMSPRLAAGQERLGAARITLTASPAFESWSFSSGGLAQPSLSGSSSVTLSSATQISIPLVISLPLFHDRWSLDLASGFASNKVSLASTDDELETDNYSLSGITDTKIRIRGKLAGESVLLTAAVNVPTGATELDSEELSALRVIAAPALNFQVPQLGAGGGGTVGLVFGRQFDNWAWALAGSYELRSGYTPISFASGIAAPDFNPGDVIHISLGGDGLVGQNGMSVALSADIFSEDELTSGGSAAPGSQLGPIFTAEWRMRFAAPRFQELSLSVVDRFRTPYKRDGETVDGSSGNYVDIGLLAAHSASPRTTLTWEISARHHTGLKADSSIISAAVAGAGLRLSVAHELRGGTVVQPFAAVNFANFRNGDASGSATGITLGLTVMKGW